MGKMILHRAMYLLTYMRMHYEKIHDTIVGISVYLYNSKSFIKSQFLLILFQS